MKIGIRALTMAALSVCAMMAAAVVSVRTADAQAGTYHMWCVVPDYRAGVAYYTSVFVSTDAASYSHDVPFTNFVQSRYSQTAQLGQCYTNDSYANAQGAKTHDMSRGVFDSVIDTGWRP
jgi:hypothetical protein